ncbi:MULTISPECIES: YqgQ family protein [unclassified Gemella]|uniref:YqgQ family protein n=1 Tax=unclassified Gemella TaxID=2624949 RepID=UPI00107336C3|nr:MULTISPECIES: YqgQ family protein [unclassified Gemella]MBF0746159.1 DUF910 family protein [Gemella sp. 19428wG2_WT2a]MBF0847734.1 DUF910 family protein [Streptococcus danieliae]TFU60444.1 DUF910 family protein [Gemella sp. WT2a]MBF0710080.1 DUF910 family protein [Gemella sp. GL1.1]NYS27424.1 DUF910 family protein [Gemella sp. GL1]
MRNFYDIQQLLKSYGIVVYMKDRRHYLDLVDFEVRELYKRELIPQKEFLLAISIINQERQYS